MNSRALIGSPGAPPGSRIAPGAKRSPSRAAEGSSLGLAGSPGRWDPRYQHRGCRAGTPSRPRRAASLVLHLLPAEPDLPGAPPGRAARSGRGTRLVPRRAGNPGVPARGPYPRSAQPAGGEAGRDVRPLPFSLRIPLILGLSAAPRLLGCRGRPAGILETVPSLSPFIKRPWAALKPRRQ